MTIPISSFNEIERDLLCGLMVKLKEEKGKVTFYPSDLRSIFKSDYTNEGLLEFSLSLREKFFKADFTIIERTTRGGGRSNNTQNNKPFYRICNLCLCKLKRFGKYRNTS